MKTAIIGSGISGLAAGAELHALGHQVTIYEANDYIGGHVKTIQLPIHPTSFSEDSYILPVELGVFMLDPQSIHPTIGAKIKELGIKLREFPLTFSFVNQVDNFSWTTQSAHSGFLKRPSILYKSIKDNFPNGGLKRNISFFLELNRFMKLMPIVCRNDEYRHMNLSEYLRKENFSKHFFDCWLLPQMMCWWGVTKEHAMSIDIQVIVQSMFLVSIMPQYIFEGGWNQFVDKLSAPYREHIRLSSPVKRVKRNSHSVEITSKELTESFENVIFAVPPNVVLDLLEKINPEEESILKSFKTVTTKIYLHKDTHWLPSSTEWSTVNLIQDERGSFCTLYYGSLHNQKPEILITWGDELQALPDPNKVIMTADLLRTIPTVEYTKACRNIHSIQGVGGIWHCGAHVDANDTNHYTIPSLWHENSFKSGVEVAKKIFKGKTNDK